MTIKMIMIIIIFSFDHPLKAGGPGGLRSHDFRLSSNLEGRRSIHAELRARVDRPTPFLLIVVLQSILTW
jgi:hypothetical protein